MKNVEMLGEITFTKKENNKKTAKIEIPQEISFQD